jgi:hypothetical protein
VKIIRNIFFIFFLLFSILSNSYSDDKIKFIDLDSLLENTNIGKKLIENLRTNNKKKTK